MEFYDEVVEVRRKPKTDKQNSQEPTMHPLKSIDGAIAASSSIDDSERTTTKRPTSSLPRKNNIQNTGNGNATSESESSDSESEENAKNPSEGFDYKQWENLNVSTEIKDLYQYIARFDNFEINFHLTLHS